jgi:hypothetical protein
MRARASEVVEDVRIGAAGVFERVGKHCQASVFKRPGR